MKAARILPGGIEAFALRWKASLPFLFVFLAIILSFFYNLHAVPLFDVDEGAFTEVTREMFERGDFISTYLNGEPYYDKPVLTYWFQAIGVFLFGLSEFAFRFPSAIAATCWVFAVYFFTREWVDKETGWIAAVITPTVLWVSLIGRAAIADSFLNLFLALSLFDLYRYFQDNKGLHRNRIFLWIGLGFLTKGPIAILIPFMVSFLFFVTQKQWLRWVKTVLHPVGITIFLGVTLPWYVAQYLKEGYTFIESFFLKHNVGRYLAPMEGHSGGLYYYILIMLVVILPYSALFVRILGRLREARRQPFDLFLWLWFFFVLIFFSLSGTKLPHYVLHGCTPLFILMAKYRHDLKSRVVALLPAAIFLTSVVLVPEIIEQVRIHADDYTKAILSEVNTVVGLDYRIWSIAALIAILVLPFAKRFQAWQSLVITGFIMIFIVGHLVLPVGLTLTQMPVKEAALIAKQHDYDVVMWKTRMPSFSVYREHVTLRREPEAGDVVFTKSNKVEQLGEYHILYQRGGVALVLVEARHE